MENRVSSSQIEQLLDHLTAHPALAKGVGLGARSKETIDREWDNLARRLNAHGVGASKSGVRWKRYWHDLKHKAKVRAAAKRRDMSDTGGGGPSSDEDLSEVDKKILAIIGKPKAVYGDSQYQTPVFETFLGTHPKDEKNDNFIIMSEAETIETDTGAILNSPSRRGDTCAKTNIEPAWVVELESRRIAAEEKIANAITVIAEAVRSNAETARMNVESMKIQQEIILKILEKLGK